MRRSRALSFALATAMFLLTLPASASTAPGGTFTDDNGNIHEAGIEAIAEAGVTLGCNPPLNTHYCPRGTVTRGEMAAFLARALALPSSTADLFSDDAGSVFEGAINRIADAGITNGCNPPTNDNFCPTRTMTRGEMAAFLARAFDLPVSANNWFVDDDGHLFESAINRIADAGITVGCNPPANDHFCPDDIIKRDQMATFLTRALGLASSRPPPVLGFGPDTYAIGVDLSPGIYRNYGFTTGCYWERLSGFSGQLSDIIANAFTSVGQIVEIKPSDIGFRATVGCAKWTNQLVTDRRADPSGDFGRGTFVIGDEIAPGTWRSTPVNGDSCYWARLSGFGGELADIVANDFTDITSIVQISPSDLGFLSEDGCGAWTKIG
jgi:S-layer homology domain